MSFAFPNKAASEYRAKQAGDEPALAQAMLQQVRLHPRYGYRRIRAMLKRERWHVKEEGLAVVEERRAQSAAKEA